MANKPLLSGAGGTAAVVVMEVAIFALIMLLFLVPGAEFLIINVLLAVGAVVLMKLKPGVNAAIKKTFADNKIATLITAAVLVIAVPFVLIDSPYWVFTIILAGLALMTCMGLNLQLGSTGMMNLASAAFYGMGAYSAGLLALHLGVPAWLTIPLGAIVAGLFSVILFIPVLKTKGHYLALVTIAFQFAFAILLDNTEAVGGPQGLKNIPLFSIFGYSFNNSIDLGFVQLSSYTNFYYFIVILLVILAIICQRIYKSWVGVTLATIRDDEVAAQTSGVQINRWKLVIFVLGNAFMGLAGAFYAHMVGFISPPNFMFDRSLVLVSIVILGGMDNIFGVILGSMLLIVLPEKLRVIQDYRFMIYGIVLIVMLIFQPRGLIPFIPRDFKELIKIRKPAKASAVDSDREGK